MNIIYSLYSATICFGSLILLVFILQLLLVLVLLLLLLFHNLDNNYVTTVLHSLFVNERPLPQETQFVFMHL